MLRNKTFLSKFLRYSVVGIVCTSIYFLCMFLCVEMLYLRPVLGASISFIIMTIFSFLLNKKYTFGGRYTHTQFVKFTTVSSIGFVMNTGIIYTIVAILSFHYIIGEIATTLIIPFVNFFLNNYWTFNSN
ncbi:GtrA family protein [Bacillus tianshenii]|nr:GtrA family protein [Bacillus tianshenii]